MFTFLIFFSGLLLGFCTGCVIVIFFAGKLSKQLKAAAKAIDSEPPL